MPASAHVKRDRSMSSGIPGLLSHPERAAPQRSASQHGTDTARGFTFWGQWLVAMILTSLLLGILALGKTGEIGSQYRILMLFALLGSAPVYALLHVYHRQHGYLLGLSRLLVGWLLLLAGLTVVAFITKTSTQFSREVTLTWATAGLAAQAVAYLPLHHLSRRYHRKRLSERTSLIVGTGPLATTLAEKLEHVRHEPVVGLVAKEQLEHPGHSPYRVVGVMSRLRELIDEYKISRLYIALPLTEAERIEDLYIDLLDANVDVVWIPDLASLMLLNHSVSEIDGLPAIHLNESPLTAYPTAAMTKAVLDRCLALLAIVALSPVLLVVAILVKQSSPGPIIFKQQRHGWNGRLIMVYKFRSMRLHDSALVKQATRADPRITPIGRFIRRTSIDELPQFFNVLQGHMSLVGPRPHAVAHNDYYTGKIKAYMARHRIKPGITGLAQINGCRGETETLDKMQRRVELDLAYINNWSLWLDMKILLKTPFTLLAKDIY